MSELSEIAAQMPILWQDIGEMKANISQINTILREQSERIVKLEANEATILEKCKNTALEGVLKFSTEVTKDIGELRHLVQTHTHLP